MKDTGQLEIRDQLDDRRRRLEVALAATGPEPALQDLLREVDAALHRLGDGTYGLCETCHDPIEDELLLSDPLVRFCMPHLSDSEVRALQEDLELAARIQEGLLPKAEMQAAGWSVARLYQPLGAVSGDYCDVAPSPDGSLFFAMGDVAGKGIAASMLMAHLQAMVRILLDADTPLDQLLEKVSRTLCETTLPAHFATLACGRAHPSGEVEMANAGHMPALVARGDAVEEIPATGLPVGMFCQAKFSVSKVSLAPGDLLLLYTDGYTEARDPENEEFGRERLATLLARHAGLPPRDLLAALMHELDRFRSGTPMTDDLSLMVLRRTP
jgi:sigma-B regulation protein RsbU (phosphoserine phosphatase)